MYTEDRSTLSLSQMGPVSSLILRGTPFDTPNTPMITGTYGACINLEQGSNAIQGATLIQGSKGQRYQGVTGGIGGRVSNGTHHNMWDRGYQG